MKKGSGEKKQGKKKFRNANYAMHRKVETKQSTLSLPELGIVYIYSIKKKKGKNRVRAYACVYVCAIYILYRYRIENKKKKNNRDQMGHLVH